MPPAWGHDRRPAPPAPRDFDQWVAPSWGEIPPPRFPAAPTAALCRGVWYRHHDQSDRVARAGGAGGNASGVVQRGGHRRGDPAVFRAQPKVGVAVSRSTFAATTGRPLHRPVLCRVVGIHRDRRAGVGSHDGLESLGPHRGRRGANISAYGSLWVVQYVVLDRFLFGSAVSRTGITRQVPSVCRRAPSGARPLTARRALPPPAAAEQRSPAAPIRSSRVFRDDRGDRRDLRGHRQLVPYTPLATRGRLHLLGGSRGCHQRHLRDGSGRSPRVRRSRAQGPGAYSSPTLCGTPTRRPLPGEPIGRRADSRQRRAQILRTWLACRPFWPCLVSNSTRWPSARSREALHLDLRLVNEEVIPAAVRRDKSKALFGVEPLDCTYTHNCHSLKITH